MANKEYLNYLSTLADKEREDRAKELSRKELGEILAMVDNNYEESEIEFEADTYLYDLVDHSAYEEIIKEDSAINYLAEYFSTNEYKDWLIYTFLY